MGVSIMIENVSALVGNSKLVSSIRRRKNILNVTPSAESIEEAKAKVQKILDDGAKKRKKKKSSKE